LDHLPSGKGKSPLLFLDELISRLLGRSSPLHPIAKRYLWTIPVVALAGFAASVLEGIGITLLVPLLSSLSSATAESQTGFLGLLYRVPLAFSPEWRLPGVAGIILGCIVLKGILQANSEILVSWIEGRVARDIRGELARRLLQVGYPFFLNTGQIRLLNIISSDSWRASEAIRSIFYIVGAAATVLVFSLLLLLTNWELFLFTALGAIGIRAVQNWLSRHVAGISEAMRLVNLELAQRMVMLPFDMVKLVRLFNQQQQEIRRFEAVSEKMRVTMLRLARVTSWAPPLSETLYSVLFLAILVGAHAGGIHLPILIAFLLLMYRMQPHLGGISAASVNIASVTASVHEVEWLMDPVGKPLPPSGTRPFAELHHAIQFDGVSFDYQAGREGATAVAGLTLDIRAGQWTALSGVSGAGKSTVVNLLGRLLAPTAGRILVDGVDLQTIDPVSWRGRLGVAGQDLELFEGTVAENIAFGAPDATREDIVAAAAVVEVDGLIAAMPQGYDTVLGQRGLSLSGGQRQRIGLARAIVHHPAVLILDEATNALDSASEGAVMARLKALTAGVTVIVISHRASTLAHCDRTIVLEPAGIASANQASAVTAPEPSSMPCSSNRVPG
jgi:subfamily B ATP-binding cassette protein MsbA